MECSMPDLEQVRGFLHAACDGRIALDALEATYIQAGAGGPVRLLYEVGGTGRGRMGGRPAPVRAARESRQRTADRGGDQRALATSAAGDGVRAGGALRAGARPAVSGLSDRRPAPVTGDRRGRIGDGRQAADDARRAWRRCAPAIGCRAGDALQARTKVPVALRPHVDWRRGSGCRAWCGRVSPGGRSSSVPATSCRAFTRRPRDRVRISGTAGRGPGPGHGVLRPGSRRRAVCLRAVRRLPAALPPHRRGAPALPCTAGAGRGGLRPPRATAAPDRERRRIRVDVAC